MIRMRKLESNCALPFLFSGLSFDINFAEKGGGGIAAIDIKKIDRILCGTWSKTK